jgi:rhodanese-related sulfurtransferase
MRAFWNKLTFNQRLAAFAALLGVLALFAGNPYKGSITEVNAKELALIVNNEVDHVAPVELADWIIKGKSDFRVIDLRTEKEYAEYHIPGAENVSMALLADYPLMRNDKIILYSEGGIHSAQAWFLLRARNFKNVYMLRGGLEDWKDLVLFPKLAGNPSPDQKSEFEKMKEISKYFGGVPQEGVVSEKKSSVASMPKIVPPAPSAAPAGGVLKKKKEGC